MDGTDYPNNRMKRITQHTQLTDPQVQKTISGISQVAINILTVQPTRFLSFNIIFQFQTVTIKVARPVISYAIYMKVAI